MKKYFEIPTCIEFEDNFLYPEITTDIKNWKTYYICEYSSKIIRVKVLDWLIQEEKKYSIFFYWNSFQELCDEIQKEVVKEDSLLTFNFDFR